MSEKLLILDADRAAVRDRIKELEQQLLNLAPEIEEALDQSSETWHDNAPFEVLRDKRSMLINDITTLKAVLYNATKQMPRKKPGMVGAGSVVELQNSKTLQRNKYYIAGDWTLRTGQLHEDARIISRTAPLGALLCGKKLGEAVRFNDVIFTLTFVG